jgi:hypothetical protein
MNTGAASHYSHRYHSVCIEATIAEGLVKIFEKIITV